MAATAAGMTAGRLIAFDSLGATLRGLLYEHDDGTRRPVVVMAHGLSATMIGMVADRYAEVLHAAGLNVLLFDHRGFGRSGGEPRQVLNRWTQARGYVDALNFVVSLPTVDRTRLALWGDSMSGSVALVTAAIDHRVRAVVVQVPACGSALPPPDADGSAFATLRQLFASGAIHDLETDRTGPMAVVSADRVSSPSILEPISAFRWFIDYGGRSTTGWENVATVESVRLPVPFHVATFVPHLRAATLFVIADDDEMPGAEPRVARAVFELAPEPKQLVAVEGGHFGLLYHPSDAFDVASRAQARFLVDQLGPVVRP